MAIIIVDIDDGGNHLLNDNTYQDDEIRLDYFTTNDPGTHLELTDSGSIYNLTTYNKSTAEINGGVVGSSIGVYDRSTLTVNDGSIHSELGAHDNSTVNITSGSIRGVLHAGNSSIVEISGGSVGHLNTWNNSTVTVSGGSIDGLLCVDDNSIIYLYGSDFSVAGQSLNYGDSLRDYGTVGDSVITGTITGILQDGSALDKYFTIRKAYSADIVIVPEPATLLLLGFGSLLLRKKR